MSENTTPDLEIEQQKLELEREKIRLERFKVWWTGVAIIVPLLVAAISISFGIWSQARQAAYQADLQDKQAKLQSEMQAEQSKLQLELQTQQARSQFELKAAEIVMNTESPLGALTKAKAMSNLFPDRLPSNFAASFEPQLYSMPIKNTIGATNKNNQFTSNKNRQLLTSKGKRKLSAAERKKILDFTTWVHSIK